MLDITTRRNSVGGDMVSPRIQFSLATLRSEGQERVFALGGRDEDSRPLNSVEEWVEESFTWKEAESLTAPSRFYFGLVMLPKQLICPG